MPVANGIFGIILSFALIFVALLIFDAVDTNIVDCQSFQTATVNEFGNVTTYTDTNSSISCDNTKTYVGIAFIILPIAILFDVIGLLPIFGGRFSIGN